MKSHAHVKDYKPVVGCLIIYKCITKLICEKLRLLLPSITSHTQGAFDLVEAFCIISYYVRILSRCIRVVKNKKGTL